MWVSLQTFLHFYCPTWLARALGCTSIALVRRSQAFCYPHRAALLHNLHWQILRPLLAVTPIRLVFTCRPSVVCIKHPASSISGIFDWPAGSFLSPLPFLLFHFTSFSSLSQYPPSSHHSNIPHQGTLVPTCAYTSIQLIPPSRQTVQTVQVSIKIPHPAYRYQTDSISLFTCPLSHFLMSSLARRPSCLTPCLSEADSEESQPPPQQPPRKPLPLNSITY